MNTKIIAHRGESEYNPENTLAAFSAALADGADAIELDVHMTSDGVVVVHHDYYLGNPDNGEGRIYEKDLAYIRSLRIGEAEKIPTLEEVFALIGDTLHYEIELKGFGKEFLDKVVALVKKYNLTSVVELTSPHAYTLTYINTLDSSLRTGMFVVPFPEWMDKKLGQMIVINNAIMGGVNVLHCPIELIDQEFIRTANDNDLLVHAADCDTDDDLRAALTAGVDQLSTNRLKKAIAWRRDGLSRY
jgi:glycerophosphoryl diester phosphodiesterase